MYRPGISRTRRFVFLRAAVAFLMVAAGGGLWIRYVILRHVVTTGFFTTKGGYDAATDGVPAARGVVGNGPVPARPGRCGHPGAEAGRDDRRHRPDDRQGGRGGQ